MGPSRIPRVAYDHNPESRRRSLGGHVRGDEIHWSRKRQCLIHVMQKKKKKTKLYVIFSTKKRSEIKNNLAFN